MSPRVAGILGNTSPGGREYTDMGEDRCPTVVTQRRQEKGGPGRVASTSSFPEEAFTEKELSGEAWRGRGET